MKQKVNFNRLSAKQQLNDEVAIIEEKINPPPFNIVFLSDLKSADLFCISILDTHSKKGDQ